MSPFSFYGFGPNEVRNGDPCPVSFKPAGDDTGPVEIKATWSPPTVRNIEGDIIGTLDAASKGDGLFFLI